MFNTLGAILRGAPVCRTDEQVQRRIALGALRIEHRQHVAVLASRAPSKGPRWYSVIGISVSDSCVLDYNAAVCAAGLGLGFCIIPPVEANGIGLFCHCEGCQE